MRQLLIEANQMAFGFTKPVLGKLMQRNRSTFCGFIHPPCNKCGEIIPGQDFIYGHMDNDHDAKDVYCHSCAKKIGNIDPNLWLTRLPVREAKEDWKDDSPNKVREWPSHHYNIGEAPDRSVYLNPSHQDFHNTTGHQVHGQARGLIIPGRRGHKLYMWDSHGLTHQSMSSFLNLDLKKEAHAIVLQDHSDTHNEVGYTTWAQWNHGFDKEDPEDFSIAKHHNHGLSVHSGRLKQLIEHPSIQKALSKAFGNKKPTEIKPIAAIGDLGQGDDMDEDELAHHWGKIQQRRNHMERFK